MVTCGNCGKTGHNKRSCPELKAKAAAAKKVPAPEPKVPEIVPVSEPVPEAEPASEAAPKSENGTDLAEEVIDTPATADVPAPDPDDPQNGSADQVHLGDAVLLDAIPSEADVVVAEVALVVAAPLEETAVPAEAEPVVEDATLEKTEEPPKETGNADGQSGMVLEAVVTEVVEAPAIAGSEANGEPKESKMLKENAVNELQPVGNGLEHPKEEHGDTKETGEEQGKGEETRESAPAEPKSVPSLVAAIEAAKAGTGGEPTKAAPAKKESQLPPLEFETFEVPEHWYQKPCVRVTGLAEQVSEEELRAALSAHTPVKSITFADEAKTTADVRLDVLTKSEMEEAEAVEKLKAAIGELSVKEQKLTLENYRPDTLLFIGNIRQEMDDAALREFFQEHGRIERAFVLRNAAGKSKGYGFVEFSHKDEAAKAKLVGGKTPSEGGKFIRVEPGDARQVDEMFSLSLFVDHLPRDLPNVQSALWKTFEDRGGPVRDVYVLTDFHTRQMKGYAFVHFLHSLHADTAWRQLDGYNVHGSNLRVGFANPTRAAAEKAKRPGFKGPARPAAGFDRPRYDDRRDGGRGPGGPGGFRPGGRFDDRGPRGTQFDRRPALSPRDGPRAGPRSGFSPPPYNRPQQNPPFNRTGPRPFGSPPQQNVRGNFGAPPGSFRPQVPQQGGSFSQQRFPGGAQFPGGGQMRPGFGPPGARPGFGGAQMAPGGQFPRPGFGAAPVVGGATARPQVAPAGLAARAPGPQGSAPVAGLQQAAKGPEAGQQGQQAEFYPQQGGYVNQAYQTAPAAGGYQSGQQQYPPQQQQAAYAGYQQAPVSQQGQQSVYAQGEGAYAQQGYDQQAYAQQGYAQQTGVQAGANPPAAVAAQQAYGQTGAQGSFAPQYGQQYAQQGQYAGYDTTQQQQVAPQSTQMQAQPAAGQTTQPEQAAYDYYNQGAASAGGAQAQDYSAYYAAQQAPAQAPVSAEQTSSAAATQAASSGQAEDEHAKAWAAFYAQQAAMGGSAGAEGQQQYAQQTSYTTSGSTEALYNQPQQAAGAEYYQTRQQPQAVATTAVGDKRPADGAATYVQPGGMESYYQQGYAQQYGNYDASKRAKF